MTAGPGTVKGIYTIDLPRPRKVAEIRFEPRFVQLYHQIWEDLRDEVMISYERAKQRGITSYERLSNQANLPITAPETTGVPAATICPPPQAHPGQQHPRPDPGRVLGGWQFLTTVGIIDPFFWGQPSGYLESDRHVGDAGHGTRALVAANCRHARRGHHRFCHRRGLGRHLWRRAGTQSLPGRRAEPLHQGANAIPRVMLAPLFVIGLGLGIQSKVALAAVLVFFIVFFNAFQGVREVDRNLLANAQILGASQRTLPTGDHSLQPCRGSSPACTPALALRWSARW